MILEKLLMYLLLSIFSIILLKDLSQDIINNPRYVYNSKYQSRFDYGSIDSGGNILEHSRSMHGAKNILRDDTDKYMLVPCNAYEKWVEISLLEHIFIDEVQFVQGEIYSSAFKHIEIQSSTFYPTDSWESLAKITLLPVSSPQKFKIPNKWVRFLKVIFKSHYGNEYYCTLNHFSVFGKSILQEIDNDYYKARQEQVNEMLEGVGIITDSENNATIFKQQLQQLDQIEVFYDDLKINEEDFCEIQAGNQFWFPNDQIIATDSITSKKMNQIDIFQAMVKYIAKTEAYLKVLDNYILYLLETQNEKDLKSEAEKFEIKIKNETKYFKKYFKELNDSDSKIVMKIKNLNKKIEYIRKEDSKIQESLTKIKFWNLILVGILGFGIVTVVWINMKNKSKCASIQCNINRVDKCKRANSNLILQ